MALQITKDAGAVMQKPGTSRVGSNTVKGVKYGTIRYAEQYVAYQTRIELRRLAMAIRLAIRLEYSFDTGAQTPKRCNCRCIHASCHAGWPDGKQDASRARSAHLFVCFTRLDVSLHVHPVLKHGPTLVSIRF